MPTFSKYCKAYPLAQLREFPGWIENHLNARIEEQTVDGKKALLPRRLNGEDFLYLHDNFTVTDGVFLEEYIIFENVTPEWINFCGSKLGFEAPQEGGPPDPS